MIGGDISPQTVSGVERSVASGFIRPVLTRLVEECAIAVLLMHGSLSDMSARCQLTLSEVTDFRVYYEIIL
jgi:hypothetical protein